MDIHVNPVGIVLWLYWSALFQMKVIAAYIGERAGGSGEVKLSISDFFKKII